MRQGDGSDGIYFPSWLLNQQPHVAKFIVLLKGDGIFLSTLPPSR
jgi:hypothetical protein